MLPMGGGKTPPNYFPMASDVITSLPQDFLKDLAAELSGRIPQEKIEADLRQARNARVMQELGSERIEGVGQKIAEIDPRLYFRMLHTFGHVDNWLDDLLADNPQLCAPGYKPRQNSLRHSKSFIGGSPV